MTTPTLHDDATGACVDESGDGDDASDRSLVRPYRHGFPIIA
ncbi:hypothetical protein ACUN9Y_00865 [Halomonas sp. V046]